MPSSDSHSDSDDDTYGPKPPPPAPIIGPTLPPNFAREDSSDDEDTYGPQLADSQSHRDYSSSKVLPSKSTEDSSASKREEWMTVVPDKIEARIGLKSVTSFSKKSTSEVNKNTKPTTPPLELPNEPPTNEDEVSNCNSSMLDVNH